MHHSTALCGQKKHDKVINSIRVTHPPHIPATSCFATLHYTTTTANKHTATLHQVQWIDCAGPPPAHTTNATATQERKELHTPLRADCPQHSTAQHGTQKKKRRRYVT